MTNRTFKKPNWYRIHEQLPIFRFENLSDSVFYVPGYSIRMDRKKADEIELALNNHSDSTSESSTVRNLLSRATIAKGKWIQLID